MSFRSSAKELRPRRALVAMLAVILAGCGDDGPGADSELAFLDVKESEINGEEATTITFRNQQRDLSATVLKSNAITRSERNAVRGNFSEIYEALAGKTHKEPGSLVTVPSIIEAAKAAGWRVAKDKSSREGGEIGEISSYRMWR